MIRYSILILIGMLVVSCTAEAPLAPQPSPTSTAVPGASVLPSPPAAAPDAPIPVTESQGVDDLNTIPAAACEPGAYVEFVNAFAQFAAQRPRFVTDAGRAQLSDFDVTLVDYRWQRESDGASLELDMQRRGTRLDLTATPVERDAEDQPVRTLGAASRYMFEHREGCWRYAGRS